MLLLRVAKKWSFIDRFLEELSIGQFWSNSKFFMIMSYVSSFVESNLQLFISKLNNTSLVIIFKSKELQLLLKNFKFSRKFTCGIEFFSMWSAYHLKIQKFSVRSRKLFYLRFSAIEMSNLLTQSSILLITDVFSSILAMLTWAYKISKKIKNNTFASF